MINYYNIDQDEELNAIYAEGEEALKSFNIPKYLKAIDKVLERRDSLVSHVSWNPDLQIPWFEYSPRESAAKNFKILYGTDQIPNRQTVRSWVDEQLAVVTDDIHRNNLLALKIMLLQGAYLSLPEEFQEAFDRFHNNYKRVWQIYEAICFNDDFTLRTITLE